MGNGVPLGESKVSGLANLIHGMGRNDSLRPYLTLPYLFISI